MTTPTQAKQTKDSPSPVANKEHSFNPRENRKKDDGFDEKVLEVARITRVVKGGRRLRFRAAVVVGNYRGQIGFGVAKANEVQKAIQKAVLQAKKNLITVPITEETKTIPYIIENRFSASKVLLKPASTGTSLIAGFSVRSILHLAGYENIISKIIGSTHKINTAYATMECLKELTK